MKKFLIGLVILAALAALGFGYYFGYDHGFEEAAENPDASDPAAFSEIGKITRDSADSSDDWYFEYKPAEIQFRERLGFEPGASCLRDGIAKACSEFEIRPNDVAAITGKKLSDYVAVQTLEITLSAPDPSASDAFHESNDYGFYGTITLNGYLDVQRRVCNPGDMCGGTVDYASFVFADGNDAIKKFTGMNDGNSFVAGDRVGIGCYQLDKARIYYENNADSGYKTGEITGPDLLKLLASSRTAPVDLIMTREIYTSGQGAPDCYSHFRNFDVL